MNVAIAVLGSSVLASILGAIVAGFFNRRKLGADATQVLTDAASGVVQRLEEENKRIIASNRDLAKRVSDLEQEMRKMTAAITVHQDWDRRAARKLRANGIQIEDPPPLSPIFST